MQKNNDRTDAELDAYYADLAERAGIPPGATCEEIAAMSAVGKYDLIGRVCGKFAEDLTHET